MLDRAVYIYQSCKFVIAIENNSTQNYVTEKPLLPLLAGGVPIVWGCEELRRLFRSEAIVDISSMDLNDTQKVAKSIVNQIQAYMAKRTKPPEHVIKEDLLEWYSIPPLRSARSALSTWTRSLGDAASSASTCG